MPALQDISTNQAARSTANAGRRSKLMETDKGLPVPSPISFCCIEIISPRTHTKNGSQPISAPILLLQIAKQICHFWVIGINASELSVAARSRHKMWKNRWTWWKCQCNCLPLIWGEKRDAKATLLLIHLKKKKCHEERLTIKVHMYITRPRSYRPNVTNKR